jgi:hypothetical protein
VTQARDREGAGFAELGSHDLLVLIVFGLVVGRLGLVVLVSIRVWILGIPGFLNVLKICWL